jgi:transposase
MSELTDEEWAALKAALDAARSGTGRPLRNERTVVEGIVWRLRNGAKWRSLPGRFGRFAGGEPSVRRWRAAQLHIRWSRSGVWERAFSYLRDAGSPELGDVFLDGTSIRAHQKAAGARGG